MTTEVMYFLHVQPGAWYVDGTFGRGGHTERILQAGGNVIAFDMDATAIAYGQEHFATEIAAGRLQLLHDNFSKLEREVKKLQKSANIAIAGLLFDFGASTDQLKDAKRGFSFESDTNLDMRMDTRLGVTARDLLQVLSATELTQLFDEFGGETDARTIAQAIATQRLKEPITTTAQLAMLVRKIKRQTGHLHPATKVFQALRIAVNTELDNIKAVLSQISAISQQGTRVITIAFHEGEDGLIKHQFKSWQATGRARILTPKPVMVEDREVYRNPSARSARLRACEMQSL